MPRLGIVEAEQQAGEGRLAAAGAAQQPEHLARLQREREVAQHRLVRPVAEGDAVELDGERPGRQRRGCPAGSSMALCSASRSLDAADAGGGLLEILHLAGDLLDRAVAAARCS